MKFFDRNTNPERIDDSVEPVVKGLLENKQLFSEDADDRPYVTEAIKYTADKQDRRKTTPYDGDNQFVSNIIDIFGFDPLDFQVECWKTVDQLDQKRRQTGNQQAGVFSAPTGFGKTEAFLGPLYQLLRSDRQDSTIIVYPRRALLQNQLQRVLQHLDTMRGEGPSDLSVGVYIGGMPYEIGDVEDNSTCFDRSGGTARFKLANCWCSDDEDIHSFEFYGTSREYTLKCENNPDHSFTDRELVLPRKEITRDTPDIILTTLESLELFALKPNYNIIDEVDSIVLDEVHLYTGLRGAHTAKIIGNINEITEQPLLWLGASATIDNPSRFAKKLFDLPANSIEAIEPPESDYKEEHGDQEHYYFMISPDDGPGASPMMIQQTMMLGHSLLQQRGGKRGKILSFIDSISQINQKLAQLEDADHSDKRKLWEYHRSGDGYENWDVVADEMGYEFLENDLRFEPVYSDAGFDAEAAGQSDVLLSTSFLEVGIDVGDINIVSQYRTPQDLSSFIQRTGRAAREEDMDSHIFVYLSNFTGDANMFYRAERFLGSELRTPLKTDNKVVEWIHEQLGAFYQITSEIAERRMRSPREEELAFFEEFVRDAMECEEFYRFLTEPGEFLSTELGIGGHLDQPLLSEEPVRVVESALDAKDRSLSEDFEEIEEYVDIEGDEVIRGENAFDEYLSHIQERVLEQIQTYLEKLEEYETVLEEHGLLDDHPKRDIVREELDAAREQVTDYRILSAEERVERYNKILADITQQAAYLMGMRASADRHAEDGVSEVGLGKIDDLQEAVTMLAGLAGDERLEQLSQERRQVYYLKQTIEQLKDYRDLDSDEKYRNNKPFLSVWYVKNLLRAAYYFERFLNVEGRSLGEVWYVPPNYFESSGQYLTVFRGDNDLDGSEESIDSIVHSYAPYRSEYQQKTGKSQLFMPDTEVVESSTEDSDSTVQFDFSSVPTDDQPNMAVPESITLDEVTDLSDTASNIVRYCPECLQIISNIDSCLEHNDRAYGKIHSDPQVKTVLRDREVESQRGALSLCNVTGDVLLEGVTLNITPATYKGPGIGYVWADEDRIEREIESPSRPLGFTLDTRGVSLDVGSFLRTLDEDVRNEISKYKDLDEVEFEYLGYHTAAHLLMQLVSDVSGVNQTMLFYGIDTVREEVFVFERTEGGQGIVDLFYEELQADPGNVLEALNRTVFNPQVINERLWADSDVLADLPPKRAPDESEARTIVSEHVDIPYSDVQDRITQEFLSTADRADQLGQTLGSDSLLVPYRVKHEIASAQMEGEEELPRDRLEELDIDLDTHAESIKSLFFSPDIDGCVENLHLSECISGHAQEDSLSYVLLERLYDHLIEQSSVAEAKEQIFNREQLPAAEFNDTNIFLTF